MSTSPLLLVNGGSNIPVSDDDPNDNDVLTWDETAGEYVPTAPPGATGGEANTASNVGTGAGVFKTKTGVDLRLRSLLEGDGVTITEGTDEVTIEVDPTVVSLLADLTASLVAVTPTGALVSETAQDAFAELDGRIPDPDTYVYATGGGKEEIATQATASGATTLNLDNGNYQKLTLTGNVTLSVTNATSGKACWFTVDITQDGTGGRSTTWMSGITWVGLGAAPTLLTTAGARELVTFLTLDGGTTLLGFYLSGTVGYQEKTWGKGGTLTTVTGGMKEYNNSGKTRTIIGVRASVGTAPTGASIIVDVLKNGTTIFTGGTDRPTIAISGTTDTGTPAVTSWANGDYLTVNIAQVGSTIAGADLTVQVWYQEG